LCRAFLANSGDHHRPIFFHQAGIRRTRLKGDRGKRTRTPIPNNKCVSYNQLDIQAKAELITA
jgi:hypothetical protein